MQPLKAAPGNSECTQSHPKHAATRQSVNKLLTHPRAGRAGTAAGRKEINVKEKGQEHQDSLSRSFVSTFFPFNNLCKGSQHSCLPCASVAPAAPSGGKSGLSGQAQAGLEAGIQEMKGCVCTGVSSQRRKTPNKPIQWDYWHVDNSQY